MLELLIDKSPSKMTWYFILPDRLWMNPRTSGIMFSAFMSLYESNYLDTRNEHMTMIQNMPVNSPRTSWKIRNGESWNGCVRPQILIRLRSCGVSWNRLYMQEVLQTSLSFKSSTSRSGANFPQINVGLVESSKMTSSHVSTHPQIVLFVFKFYS